MASFHIISPQTTHFCLRDLKGQSSLDILLERIPQMEGTAHFIAKVKHDSPSHQIVASLDKI